MLLSNTPVKSENFNLSDPAKGQMMFHMASVIKKSLCSHIRPEVRLEACDFVRLTEEESKCFVQALLHPAAPNAKLRAAFGRYRAIIAA